jgi:hypothetical protein
VVALRADPESPEAVADAIRDAVTRREELAAAGRLHAGRFSWERTAATMLATFEERS